MKTYAKIIDDIIVYTVKSSNEQFGMVEIDFDIGQPKLPDQVFKYSTRSWIDVRTEDEKFNLCSDEIKTRRNVLLQFSDWTQLPNGPLTVEVQQEWAVYRQQLRDITTQSGYPFDVVWPTPPA